MKHLAASIATVCAVYASAAHSETIDCRRATPALCAMNLYSSGDLTGALAQYNKILKENPYDAQTLINRAVIKEQLKDTKGALADYEAAYRYQPSLAIAKANIDRLTPKPVVVATVASTQPNAATMPENSTKTPSDAKATAAAASNAAPVYIYPKKVVRKKK